MANVEMLRRELEWIKTHREAWNQGDWMSVTDPGPTVEACKTQGCLAGNAAVHSRLVRRVVRMGERWNPSTEQLEPEKYVDLVPLRRFTHDRGDGPFAGEPWAAAGQEALDLSDDEASLLFDGANSLWRLFFLANEITDGAIVIPADLIPDVLCEYCGDVISDGGTCCADEDYDDDDEREW